MTVVNLIPVLVCDLERDREVRNDAELEHALAQRYDGLNHFRLSAVARSTPPCGSW